MLHFFYIGEGAFENKKLTAIDFAVIPLAKIEEEINKDEVKPEEEFTRKVEIPSLTEGFPLYGGGGEGKAYVLVFRYKKKI